MNSPLVEYTEISPNKSVRSSELLYIIPHCVVGLCTIEALGHLFNNKARYASSNYGIDKDGRVGLFVEEKDRSWCTSSSWVDDRGITIECASETFDPYTFPDKTYNRLIDLMVDICQRYNKDRLLWFGDKETSLNYTVNKNELVILVHRWFENKSCPGQFLIDRMPSLVEEVNNRLKPETPSEWAKNACEKAIKAGIITGYGDGKYGWKDPITREQMIVILDRLGLL